MGAGRIVLLIFGIIFLLIAFVLIAGGGVILAVDSSFKDGEGFYNTQAIPVFANSSAVISSPADFQIDPVWFWRQRNPITIRIEAVNSNASEPVFIGIARDSDLNSYLSGASYDEVTGFTLRSNRLDLSHHSGAAVPADPTNQSFWVASASGTGEEQLLWDITSGSYSFVLMNADGSAPIDAEVSLGARIPQAVRAVGLGILIGGIVLLVIAGVMIFFAIRGW